MHSHTRLRRRSGEDGQTVVLAVIAMVALLALSAFAIDVGYVYYAHRSLQASADAAALAGAQQLPDTSAATATAKQFGTGSGAKNQLHNVGTVTETISTKCLSSLPGCDPANAVVAQESAQVPTFFARVLGINSFNIRPRRPPARTAASSRWTSCSSSTARARCACTPTGATTRPVPT